MKMLKILFNEWNEKYFQGKLNDVALNTYSRRSSTKGFFRSFRWSIENSSININLYSSDLQPRTEMDHYHTLLHEMTHAYMKVCGLPTGHNPRFKNMLRSLTEQVFGISPVQNISHVINMKGARLVSYEPIQVKPTVSIPVQIVTRYRVPALGKIGTFISESNVYGKRHIVLAIEGFTRPLTTPFENVVAV